MIRSTRYRLITVIGAAIILLMGISPEVSWAQHSARIIPYFTRWHVPDLCAGKRDPKECSLTFALTADNTVLYVFSYHNWKIYQFTSSSAYTEYDLSGFFAHPASEVFTDIIPLGTDFVLIINGGSIYKYNLSKRTLSEVAEGKYPGFQGCHNPVMGRKSPNFMYMKSGGLVLVCLYTGRDTLNLGMLNPFTEKWQTIAESVSGKVPSWAVLLAGQDNRLYMQDLDSLNAVRRSVGQVVDIEFYSRGLQEQKWMAKTIPVTQLEDWKRQNQTPDFVSVYLTAVDALSNVYVSLEWDEDNGNGNVVWQNRLVKMNAAGQKLWSISNISFSTLDVMADGSLIVAQPDEKTGTTDIRWIGVETQP